MARRHLSYFDDGPLVALAMFAVCLVVAISIFIDSRMQTPSEARIALAIGGIVVVPMCLLLVWRVAIIRRINRFGKLVSATVTAVKVVETYEHSFFSKQSTTYCHLTYSHDGQTLSVEFPWSEWRMGGTPTVNSLLPLVIDPYKPSRCYVNVERLSRQKRRSKRRI